MRISKAVSLGWLVLCSPASLTEARPCAGPARSPQQVAVASFALEAEGGQPEASAPKVGALQRAPAFLWFEQASGLAHIACAPGALSARLLTRGIQDALQRADLDPQLALVLTSAPLPCQAMFYVPVKNDVLGIGYQHSDPRERFDDSPGRHLEGIAFLNDWPYFSSRRDEFSAAVSHELAHRWGARIQAQVPLGDPKLLSGRELTHWSYFLDTDASVLEGNRFEPTDVPARFRAYSPFSASGFSDVDLYLMGVLPPELVRPMRLLHTDEQARDCQGLPLHPGSPPQWCAPLSLSGRFIEVSVKDIIRQEGARVPAATTVPRAVDVAVVVLDSSGTADGLRADCTDLSEAIGVALADFGTRTGSRLTLRNLSRSAEVCPSPGQDSGVGACAVHHAGAVGLSPPFLLALAGLLMRRLGRHRMHLGNRTLQCAAGDGRDCAQNEHEAHKPPDDGEA